MPKAPAKKNLPRAAVANAAAKAGAGSTALLDRIEALIDQLRPSEQLVGRFVLRHPNLVISLSFPEIAAKCGVSQPTVARFCVAAGFTGYRDFKLRLAQSLAHGVPFVHHDVGMQDSMADVGAKVFDRGIAALVSVRNHLDPDALTRATKLLAEASRIEHTGLADDSMRGESKDLEGSLDHGIQWVAHDDHHSIWAGGFDLLGNARDDFGVGAQQIVPAHSRFAGDPRSDDDHIAIGRIGIVVRTA
jgi:hypothetical protein